MHRSTKLLASLISALPTRSFSPTIAATTLEVKSLVKKNKARTGTLIAPRFAQLVETARFPRRFLCFFPCFSPHENSPRAGTGRCIFGREILLVISVAGKWYGERSMCCGCHQLTPLLRRRNARSEATPRPRKWGS